jgi:uncharacterized membrane protein YbhN (UPF0104 family)
LDKIKKILKLAVFLVCAVYIVKYFYANWDSLQIAFKINKLMIAAIILISVTTLITFAYRFKIIMHKCSGKNPPFWEWFKVIMLARFYNLFFAQSGNIYRGVELKRRFGISYTDYVSASVSFGWMDICLDLIITGAIIILIRPEFKLGNFKAYQFVALLLLVIICLPILADLLLKRISTNAPSLLWIKSKLSQVITATISNIKDLSYLAKIIIWGLLVAAQTLVVYYILFKSFEIKLDIPSLMLFYALLKLSSAVIITPGNIGIQEIAFGVLSTQIGGGMAQGILISAISRVLGSSIIIILALILGGSGLLSKRKTVMEIDDVKS